MHNPIISLPHPNLRKRSQKVGIITNDIMQLIDTMKTATLDWEAQRTHEVGVALAAVQIDTLLRVIVIRNNFDNKQDKTFHVFINPEITKYEGALVEDYEGCLSVQNIYGKVPRYHKVRVKALNEHGKEVRVTAEGFLARIFQHEIDHTNGMVFIDHIRQNHGAFYRLDGKGTLKQLNYDEEIAHNADLWPQD
jgi:peptide deformylase